MKISIITILTLILEIVFLILWVALLTESTLISISKEDIFFFGTILLVLLIIIDFIEVLLSYFEIKRKV
ncbi:MAG: hypothetical protein OH319_02185 [Candidatus Parvarchaeota archaeon]|nr:hypothetical protein [Candidatus Jingweiarchaeum tengchongense]MCW1298177.1 hypothetical protein [Candidatus Jingweiarchaeum tengchongense]MCW1299975.1 hypothetical protein [Candidatus Jingweiarchaeum tengchongense]MCW1305035.1 hypothetical protein [Candidatus Jingweiarchaeum tengchongense]MCW1309920.1 hypothetical protein [Candidatus Jingweiarchaeum tengchongense]